MAHDLCKDTLLQKLCNFFFKVVLWAPQDKYSQVLLYIKKKKKKKTEISLQARQKYEVSISKYVPLKDMVAKQKKKKLK